MDASLGSAVHLRSATKVVVVLGLWDYAGTSEPWHCNGSACFQPAVLLDIAPRSQGKRGPKALLTQGAVQISSTCRSKLNGTRQVAPSPVPMVAARWLTRTTTPVMARCNCSHK